MSGQGLLVTPGDGTGFGGFLCPDRFYRQNFTDTSAAQVDSVAAIIRRLAYWLLISEDAEQFAAIATNLKLTSNESFDTLRGNVIHGRGLGRSIISSYSPSLKRQQVDGAIAHLKTTGLMAGIVSKVQAQVEAIIEANTRAEKSI